MKTYYKLVLFAILTFANTIYSQQLASFNLSVTKTDETCNSNGSLSFTATNLTPNSAVIYKVYKLPNTTTPIATQTTGYLGGLKAASYKVVATQSLGNRSNQQQKDVTIIDNIIPLKYDITSASSTLDCSGTGKIIINVTSGTAVNYEIFSGPAIMPLQNSNVFEPMPPGNYRVRVFDNCGIGVVKTFTLTIANTVLSISETTYPETTAGCDSITVTNVVTATSGTINYPLTVTHKLGLLDINGNEIILTQNFLQGPSDALEVSAVLPRPYDEEYNYDLIVADNCNSFERTDNQVDPDPLVNLIMQDAPCSEKFLTVTTTKFTPPYTITFLNAPEGFNQSDYNSLNNGPFTDSQIVFGSPANTVPFGNYIVEITDACGRKATDELLVEFIKPTPNLRGNNNGCFSLFGRISLQMPLSNIITATIISAPDTYTEAALPQNVDEYISNGRLVLSNMPIGDYILSFKDDCGNEYQQRVRVPPFVERPFVIKTQPDCTPGYGAATINSGNGKLISVVVTQAPSGYPYSLPHDVTANINSSGVFYINTLPQGEYTFVATDVCEIVTPMTENIEGYQPVQNIFTFTPQCSAFSVKVEDTSNGTQSATYWLQKYNTTTQTWGHPGNNSPYIEGAVPTTSTGVRLTNNVARNNLNYNGKFRIVKNFQSFENDGSVKNCLEYLGEFYYYDEFEILGAYNLACAGNPNDVLLEAVGYVENYRIIKKNGADFLVENGDNNIFSNLESAEYIFQIEDACGNIRIQTINIAILPSLATATPPGDMLLCTEDGGLGSHQFNLGEQTPLILGLLHEVMYTVTYHLTQEDADAGTNPLPLIYSPNINGQTIYARVIHNDITLCYSTTPFKLHVGKTPKPRVNISGTICDGKEITLTASSGFSEYLWSTGETTRSIKVNEAGIYTVEVKQAYGDKYCEGSTSVEVENSYAPSVVKIEIIDWNEHTNSIIVHTQGGADYEFSIDGINYQSSNAFENLDPGLYTVYVNDRKGCGNFTQEVVLMSYPKFFTPNGDGVNDTWRIKFAAFEPNLKVTIFDRYGKIITSLTSNSEGWDGTYNGAPLPSTDYWFVAVREDGRELKGHFAMKR